MQLRNWRRQKKMQVPTTAEQHHSNDSCCTRDIATGALHVQACTRGINTEHQPLADESAPLQHRKEQLLAEKLVESGAKVHRLAEVVAKSAAVEKHLLNRCAAFELVSQSLPTSKQLPVPLGLLCPFVPCEVLWTLWWLQQGS